MSDTIGCSSLTMSPTLSFPRKVMNRKTYLPLKGAVAKCDADDEQFGIILLSVGRSLISSHMNGTFDSLRGLMSNKLLVFLIIAHELKA